MSKAVTLRRTCWVGLTFLVVDTGCTHNYYYGATPGCPPVGQTVTTQLGQVCDVPSDNVITSSAPPSVVSQANPSSSVAVEPNPRRVVISRPSYNPVFNNRLRWRRPLDPESVATTRVEGALPDSTVK